MAKYLGTGFNYGLIGGTILGVGLGASLFIPGVAPVVLTYFGYATAAQAATMGTGALLGAGAVITGTTVTVATGLGGSLGAVADRIGVSRRPA